MGTETSIMYNNNPGNPFKQVYHCEEANTICRDLNTILDAVKLAYRKHWLNDDSIGWDELGDYLGNTLMEVLGDSGYQEWLETHGELEKYESKIDKIKDILHDTRWEAWCVDEDSAIPELMGTVMNIRTKLNMIDEVLVS